MIVSGRGGAIYAGEVAVEPSKTSKVFLDEKQVRLQLKSSRKDTTPIMQVLCARTKNEIPLNKWVHVGCEVCTDIIRIYFNDAVAGEMHVTCTSDSLKKISLVGANENDSIDVHGVEILPTMSCIKDYFVKNPPVQLHFDATSVTDIEEDSDGVWSVVGGKVECFGCSFSVREGFEFEVVLLYQIKYVGWAEVSWCECMMGMITMLICHKCIVNIGLYNPFLKFEVGRVKLGYILR